MILEEEERQKKNKINNKTTYAQIIAHDEKNPKFLAITQST